MKIVKWPNEPEKVKAAIEKTCKRFERALAKAKRA